MKTVIAAFCDRADVDQAIHELRLLDLEGSNIQILSGGEGNPYPKLVARRVPEDRAVLYAEVARRGAPVVIIEVEDPLAEPVAQLLDEHGSLDLESAARRWRTAGWQGYSEGSQPFAESDVKRERLELERESFAVVEEELYVGERGVEAGGLRFRTFVAEVPVDSTFTEEEYVVIATTEEPVIENRARVDDTRAEAGEDEQRQPGSPRR
jgi:hypothetical protein